MKLIDYKTYIIIGGIMDKIDSFKTFVKSNPVLVTYIKKGEMTWQKFYELYDIYGEDNNIWDSYLKQEEKNFSKAASVASAADVISWIKSINLDSVQEGVQSLQRVIGVIEDITNKNSTTTSEYKPRPLYKHFDD